MNTQERKVMELALEVIQDYVDEYGPHEKDSGAAHTLMKLNQALEQSTEQEPVAFLTNRRQRLNVEFNATGLTLMPKSVDWKIPLYTQPQETATAWDKGYQQGIEDERTSEANIGIAGFNAKVKPARQNPYTQPQEAAPRKPLTHEQRFDLLTKFEPHKNKWEAPAILIDMVEAAHGITGEKE